MEIIAGLHVKCEVDNLNDGACSHYSLRPYEIE
jgi:hypothetical protein